MKEDASLLLLLLLPPPPLDDEDTEEPNIENGSARFSPLRRLRAKDETATRGAGHKTKQ
jgi:hypothetical protein